MQLGGAVNYPRDGSCSTGIVQKSDGPLVGRLGLRPLVSLSLVVAAVVVHRPVHAEEVEPLADVINYLGEGFLMPRVVCGCLLAVACDISISIRASSTGDGERSCHAMRRLGASKLPRIMYARSQARAIKQCNCLGVTPVSGS